MKKLGTGMTAVSLAGHDTGKRYMIMKAEGEYVYLADGKIRTIENQKKKKVKHIQVAYEIAPEIQKLLDEGNELTNERIKRVLKNRKSGAERFWQGVPTQTVREVRQGGTTPPEPLLRLFTTGRHR